MSDTGVRRPALNAALCGALAVGGVVAVAWGALEMHVNGRETAASGLSIAFGILIAVIAGGMSFLFARGARLVRNVRDGRDRIARWIVAADDVEAFRANNARRNDLGPAYRSGYTPPDPAPPEGLEVIFVTDGVMVGDTYFGLVTTGMSTFFGPQMLSESPLCIEFGTVLVWTSHGTTMQTHREIATLRIPVGRIAAEDAKRVLTHFKKVEAREIVVNPGFYRGRMRFGVWVTSICIVMAAVGFGANEARLAWGDIPLFLAVCGTVGGLGGVVLFLVAWYLSARQHGRI